MDEREKVYQNVATTLREQLDEVIATYEDNLATKMASEVKGYDSDLCPADGYSQSVMKYGKLRETAILDLVEAMLFILFANEPEEV